VLGLTLPSHGLPIVGDTLDRVELEAELDTIAAAAAELAASDEALSGVIPTEPEPGRRVYLCAFHGRDSSRAWIALDADARPLQDRRLVRAAVSIAALCELAEEAAGGGKLDDLRAQLRSLRLTENPEGIEQAEEAALELERTIGVPPRLATPEHLDAIGFATRRLEDALGEGPGSPFGQVMKQAMGVVGELEAAVLGGYKGELS
jgi:hypothetical protein